MKAQDILKALGREKCSSKIKEHAKQLSDIFGLVKELKKIGITSVTVSPCDFEIGRETRRHNWNSKPTIIEGEKIAGEMFVIETKFGRYSQKFPLGVVSLSFRSLLTEFLPAQTIEKPKPDFEFYFDKKQTEIIKAGIKFASNDSLRPAMQCVKIEVKQFGLVNVIATDGHKLYFEQFINPLLTEQTEFLLPVSELKKAGKELNIELFKFSEGNWKYTKGIINGIHFKQDDECFPDYLSVWPDYSQYIEVLRDDLITAVKLQLPFANKTTHQLRVYFNGCVQVSAEDLDFMNESNAKVDYLKKTTEDFEIGFNGKFLLDCLTLSKENKVRIYSNGKANRAVIIDDKALLMPVMLNQYA